MLTAPRNLGTVCEQRSSADHAFAAIIFHEVCTGTVRTKEQSKRRVCNLKPIMVLNDRQTCKDRHAAELILARSTRLHQGRIHCRRLVFSLELILAVTRRTIHYR